MVNTFLRWLAGCSDYEQIKEQLEYYYTLSHYDHLTGLANRLHFMEEAEKILKHCKEDSEAMTIFLIDLDNFKMINDTHGHQAGNVLLQQVAHRLISLAKARNMLARSLGRIDSCGSAVDSIIENETINDVQISWPNSNVVARLGGDEFVMLFEHMDKHEAEIMGQQITQELKEVVMIGNFEVSISASVGGSIFPWDGQILHDLLKAADLAMYAAKDGGKDRHVFHEKSMNTKVERRVEAELAVREIIHSKTTTVYYQPILDTTNCRIIGAEALLRGKKATDKFFNPMELIAAAEDTNLIIPLGEIILRSACRFARKCIDVVGEDCEAFVSVNVSAVQLTDPTFARQVESALHDSDLTPDHLVLEITETMLMQNFEDSEKTLNKLRNLGIRISIDDFGKGYSSFSYLQKLPIDKIKIDSSFIQSLGLDNKANEIVKGIILMAEALGMHTCAEGVETDVQFNKLREYGCEQVQGYYKYKALSEQDFVDVLNKKKV